jgi:hypothetical protein
VNAQTLGGSITIVIGSDSAKSTETGLKIRVSGVQFFPVHFAPTPQVVIKATTA